MDYQEAIENYNWLEVEFEKLKAENEALKARLTEPAQEPEPVAWRALNFAEHGGVYAYRDHDEPFVGVSGSNVGEPLYTTPPDQSAQ